MPDQLPIIGTVEATDRANKSRSLNDVNNQNSKCKGSTAMRKQKSKKSSNTKSIDDYAICELPVTILDGLAEIGWAGGTTEIQIAYVKFPKLVENWLSFACNKSNVKNRAKLLRDGLRSKEMVPYSFCLYPQPKWISENIQQPANNKHPIQVPIDVNPIAITAWQTVVTELEREVPIGNYLREVLHTYVISYHEGLLQVATRNKVQLAWLNRRIKMTAERLLIGILNREVHVQFVLQNNNS